MKVFNPDHPVRFGIVGCGTISETHAQAISSIKGAALTACCDVDPRRAADFARRHNISPAHAYADLEVMLGDDIVDAVSVCTPSGLHADIAIAALESGRPVIVEKPMDVTVAACERLLAAQRASGQQLGIISQHRFDPASVRVRRLLDEGSLGRVILIEAQIKWYRTQQYYDSGDWRGTTALDGGGCLMNQGVHTVDLLRWLGGPVSSVYGTVRTAAHERIEVEDVAAATLTFRSGAIGSIVASTAAYPGYPATLSVHGQCGSVIISGDTLQDIEIIGRDREFTGQEESAAGHAVSVARGGTASVGGDETIRPGYAHGMPLPGTPPDPADEPPPSKPSWEWGDAHEAQLRDFVAAVRAGRPPQVDGQSGREAVELVTAIYESSRTGRVVYL